MKPTKQDLLNHGPCEEGRKFLTKHRTLEGAWKACNDPEWIIWALSKYNLWDEMIARKFAIACAEHTLHFFEEKYPADKRPREALEIARRIANGEQIDDKAWSAARSAAESAARSAAESAARSAARSAAESAAESESKWQADVLRAMINQFNPSKL